MTSALPRAGVVAAGVLTEGSAGRFDSAVADLSDGRRVVVRAPADADAGAELAAEVRALRALTPGVRALLPFRAPELLGESGIGEARAVVVDFLPGYRVDAAHVPGGPGAATSIGEALAALHALPLSIVRAEGLPVRTPQQVRDDVARVVERAAATRSLPATLRTRWLRALAADRLWRFEPAVVQGGAGAASFLFEDADEVPRVTGMLEWHGLSVGDPATDLQWLASAPDAADDVYEAYAASSQRAPDPLLRERSRLYAELEFAKWLVHGHDSARKDIVEDATALLESLADGVHGEDLVPDDLLDVDDAIALLDRVPAASAGEVDTSMQTDAYDPEELALWIATEVDASDAPAATPPAAESPDAAPVAAFDADDTSTAPIRLPVAQAEPEAIDVHGSPEDAAAEASRAADAALRRWTGTDR
ncbi:hypothetical protein GCM10009739_25680 [Microbacterium ulmi]